MKTQDLARILCMVNEKDRVSPRFPNPDEPLPGNLHYFPLLEDMPRELRNIVKNYYVTPPEGPCTILSDHAILNSIRLNLEDRKQATRDSYIIWLEWDEMGLCFYSSSREIISEVVGAIEKTMNEWFLLRYRGSI